MTDPSANVMIAVPNTGKIRPETCQSIEGMRAGTRLAKNVDVHYLTCAPLVLARHVLTRIFLSDPSRTHLFFIDSDMGLPSDALDRLLALRSPLACLPCPILAPGLPGADNQGLKVATNIWQLVSPPETPIDRQWVRHLDPDMFPSKPFTCHGTGLACCLIQRDLLENMHPPLFALAFSEDHAELRVGEDAHFFNQARELGYSVVVDPGALCDHFKEVDLTHFEDFFLDEPVDWKWCPSSIVPKGVSRNVFIAAVLGDREAHAGVASYLERERKKSGSDGACFFTGDYASSLKEAVRHFLGRRDERYLLLLDDRTVPADDFLERALASPVPAGTGLFREKMGGLPVWGCWQRQGSGSLARLESVHGLTNPVEIAHASLRATLLSREALGSIGTTWIDVRCMPADAGKRLAETLASRLQIPMTVFPVGCRHFDVLGLRQVLEAKVTLKARLRLSVNP